MSKLIRDSIGSSENSILLNGPGHYANDDDSKEGESSEAPIVHEGLWVGSSVNLASAAIGLGILSLPYTMHNAGLGLGAVLFVVMGLVTIYSLDVLVSSAELCGKYTYQNTVKEIFGTPVSMLVGGIIMFSSSGSTITSFRICADLIAPIFEKEGWYESSLLQTKPFLMFLAFLILFPLCYLRRINSLRHASGGAVISFLYMTGLVVVSFFLPHAEAEYQYVGEGIHAFRSIPIIVYAYTCHTQAIPVYAELKNRSSQFMYRVIWGGVFLSFSLYATVGIFGYLTFGEKINDNVLLNYPNQDIEVTVGRLMICSAIILGYPMSSWVMRDSFEQIYFYVMDVRTKYDRLDPEEESKRRKTRHVSWRQNFIETLVILGLSMGIAIAIPRINTVFGLVGSTSSVTLNFIVPGLMYIKLTNRLPAAKFPPGANIRYRKYGAIALVLFGLVIGVLGTTTTIIGLVG